MSQGQRPRVKPSQKETSEVPDSSLIKESLSLPALLLPGWVNLGKLSDLSDLQIFYLKSKDNNIFLTHYMD